MNLDEGITQDRLSDEQAAALAESCSTKYEAFRLGVVEGLGLATNFIETVDKVLLSSPMPDNVRAKFVEKPEECARNVRSLTCSKLYDMIGLELEDILRKAGGNQDELESLFSTIRSALNEPSKA